MQVNIFNSEHEWLQYKGGKIGASNISKLLPNGKGDILSVGGKTYIKSLFADTVADDIIEPYTNIDMQHGKDTEPEAITELGKRYPWDDIEHFGSHNFLFCQYDEFSGCSPDALISENGVYVRGIEIKCPTSKEKHLERLLFVKDNESLKSHDSDIYAQIQFNMLCFNLPEWLFVSYYPYMHNEKARLCLVTIKADTELQETMKAKIKAAKAYFQDLSKLYEEVTK